MSGFQVMPPLAPEERVELEASIRAHGVQVPILVAADGTIVDGHHRDEIARKHNLHCPRTVLDKSEPELRGLAFSLNLHRRHLTREQKRAVVAESIKADPQLSDREHGRRTGVDKNTAAKVRAGLESTGEIHQSDGRVSGDGRVRPATQPRHEITVTDDDGTAVGGMVDDRDPADMSDQDWIDAAYDTEAEFDDSDQAPVVEMPQAREPEPAKRRRPLEEGFFDATMRLTKAVTSLENLGNDDRLPRNKEKVARYRSDLLRAIDALQCVADQLNT